MNGQCPEYKVKSPGMVTKSRWWQSSVNYGSLFYHINLFVVVVIIIIFLGCTGGSGSFGRSNPHVVIVIIIIIGRSARFLKTRWKTSSSSSSLSSFWSPRPCLRWPNCHRCHVVILLVVIWTPLQCPNISGIKILIIILHVIGFKIISIHAWFRRAPSITTTATAGTITLFEDDDNDNSD